MATVPGSTRTDSTLALLREGYDFLPRRFQRHGTDVVQVRLLLQRTTCLQGADAARLLYDRQQFRRHRATPWSVRSVLIGRGAVEGLDDEAHRARKAMFTSMMSPDSVQRLADLAGTEWLRRIPAWQARDRVRLHDEVREIHCRAICDWAGVPLEAARLPDLTRELGALVDGVASVRPAQLRARIARRRVDRWSAALVRAVRRGDVGAAAGSALAAVAWHRDERRPGTLLPARTAGVELVNLLRPTVAVARYVVFAALALHDHPQWRDRVRQDEADLDRFVQEVRRYYPFFPAVPARARRDVTWRGYRIPAGRRVLLDLYGTNRDPRRWERPEEFRPERFRDTDVGPFDMIPQGGDGYREGHRCPGEWATIALTRTAVRLLTTVMQYELPPQDLRLRRSRIPALPRSGVVLTAVRARPGT